VVLEQVLEPIFQEQASHDRQLIDSSIWVRGRQDVVGIRWEQWQRRFWSTSCEGNWHRASKLATFHQDELHRVGANHEDQAASEEPLGGHRARGCHAAGRLKGVGRHHQHGAAEDAGIVGGEGDRRGGVGGGQVFADRQRGCLEREGATAEDGVQEHSF
jgi:hypothetical protein